MGKKAVTSVLGSMIAGIFTYVGVGIGSLDALLIVGSAFAESLDPITRMAWQITAWLLGLGQTIYTITRLFKRSLFHVFFSAVPFFSVVSLLWSPSSGYGAIAFAVVLIVAFLYDDST
jgi:hypothetical protein